jgi:hypothetical protein
MAKASGWANWSARQRSGRARDRELPTNREELEQFAENSPGPVANKLFEEKVIKYNDKGEIVVDRAVVEARAKRFVEDSRDATYSKDYVVRAYQEEARERGETLTTRQAENAYNREQAARARAILVAAEVGKVKLTEAQERRLKETSEGNYLRLVYNQYKSGERGTVIGVKDKNARGRSTSEEASRFRDFRREEFLRNIGRHYQERQRAG